MKSTNSLGTLYVIATPIGNLQDVTFRALETLGKVDIILCEDTKVTIKLLNFYNIKKPLISYNNFNETNKLPELINMLLQGNNIALVSDAGTPLVSDPGFVLVRTCREQKIPVIGLPGASSVTVFASISGIPANKFIFLGFLDKSAKKQQAMLAQYHHLNTSIIALESPNRLIATLQNLQTIYGSSMLIAVGKELTKLHEKVFYNTIEAVINEITDLHKEKIKGEYTIMFLPPPPANTQSLEEYLTLHLNQLSATQLAKAAAKEFSLNKDEVYNKIINLKDNK